MKNRNEERSAHWTPAKSRADWNHFIDMLYSLRNKIEDIVASNNSLRCTRVTAKEASVYLRTLLIDEKIKQFVLHPKFHKLARMKKRKQQSWKVSLHTMPGGMGACLGRSERIRLHDLAGWTYGKGLTDITLETGIFNCHAPPELELAEWKKQPMIRIVEGSKDEEYTLGDLVKYVANKEGAHWDFEKRGSLGRIENISNPSNITYPHWVVLCVACYIYTRIHEGMKTNEGAWRQELQQLWMDTRSGIYCRAITSTTLTLPLYFQQNGANIRLVPAFTIQPSKNVAHRAFKTEPHHAIPGPEYLGTIVLENRTFRSLNIPKALWNQ